MRMYVHISTYTCGICIYVYEYIQYVYIHIHAHANARGRTSTNKDVHMCICICVHVHIRAAGQVKMMDYSLLHLECHLILISNLNLIDLFSTERDETDMENKIIG